MNIVTLCAYLTILSHNVKKPVYGHKHIKTYSNGISFDVEQLMCNWTRMELGSRNISISIGKYL